MVPLVGFTAALLLVACGTAAPATATTPSPSARPSGPTEAVQTARDFAIIYLDYNWWHPSDPHELKEWTTDRLYSSLVENGTTPDGMPAPWTEVNPSIHEQDSIDFLDTASISMGSAQAAVVHLTLIEHVRTDGGSRDTPKELDLSLVSRGGIWLVDWVTERKLS